VVWEDLGDVEADLCGGVEGDFAGAAE
jgi:hypothetical protein